jgi:nucleoid-associated protein YgaU
LKRFYRLYLSCVLLLSVAACASPVSRFRNMSLTAFERVRASGLEALFPSETRDFYNTVNQGNAELAKGDIPEADAFYSLALGKADILKNLYLNELKRRDEVARRELEMKRQAEAELELRKKMEREQAEELAREAAAQARKLEAEKAEARRKAERSRQEKEQQYVPRHTVKRGETLPQIAARAEVYGDASLWPLIYKSNRDQISNPAVLWPGQVLRIPRSADKSEISEARRFASEHSLR